MEIQVFGLGTSVLDVIMLVESFPAGDVVQQALDCAVDGGGPVATAMATLARLDVPAAMLDSIGDDWRGRLILETFQRDGVEVKWLKEVKGAQSFLATLMVRRSDGERAILFAPGTAPELGVEDIPWDALARARFLHVNGRHWEACLEACRFAREHGVQVSFDGGAHRYRPELRELLPLVDLCLVARHFAQACSGLDDPLAGGQALLELGPEIVGVTDGARGSWILSRAGDRFHQPAFKVEPLVDTTGCGDAYHGAFIYGLLRGRPLREAAAIASAAAALNARALGGRAALPGEAELLAFLEDAGGR